MDSSQADRTASPPPVWDNVPFDVGCARCGHDLRGLTDPTCPACALTFDWADAVPIEQLTCLKCGYHLYGLTETRCPECGESFTWDEVLAAYHRTRNPLFEYQWRRRPIRSLFGTWVQALRPGRFWRSVNINDPPKLGALVCMFAVSLALFLVFVTVVDSGCAWLYRVSYRGFTSSQSFRLIFFFWGSAWYNVTVLCAAWGAFSLGALLILQPSMRLFRVRFAQVVRVWAYAVTPVIPAGAIVFYTYYFVVAAMGVRYYKGVDAAVVLLAMMWVVRSLSSAYRYYLGMPHAIGVAIAAQIIAFLAVGVCDPLLLGGPGLQFFLFFLSLARLLGF